MESNKIKKTNLSSAVLARWTRFLVQSPVATSGLAVGGVEEELAAWVAIDTARYAETECKGSRRL